MAQNTEIRFQPDSHFKRFLHSISSLMTNYSTENSLSSKACVCEAGATNRSTAKTDSWLYDSGQLLSQNSRDLSAAITLVWISAMYLLIIPMAVVDIDAPMGWFVSARLETLTVSGLNLQVNHAIARMTARCAQYMSALKNVGLCKRKISRRLRKNLHITILSLIRRWNYL